MGMKRDSQVTDSRRLRKMQEQRRKPVEQTRRRSLRLSSLLRSTWSTSLASMSRSTTISSKRKTQWLSRSSSADGRRNSRENPSKITTLLLTRQSERIQRELPKTPRRRLQSVRLSRKLQSLSSRTLRVRNGSGSERSTLSNARKDARRNWLPSLLRSDQA